jgi:GT2 family glycosyltransferase
MAEPMSSNTTSVVASRQVTYSVILCAYTEQRFEALLAAVASVQNQRPVPEQTIVVVDHNDELLERARSAFPGAVVLPNLHERGLSGARNTGVGFATGEVVAFLDDDAVAAPDWSRRLLDAYRDARVVGTGGLAVPRWEAEIPRWLPSEFLWTVGCSYRGLPTVPAPIRNPIGANMSFRREVFDRAGGFRPGIGRLGKTPLGCEETEFSIRARRLEPDGVIMHLPSARVDHLVTPERASWRYFRRRCWSEGLSKALVSGGVGAQAALASEWSYTLGTLPLGVMRGVAAALRGDRDGLRRAAAIVAGLAITTAGYLRGRLRAVASAPHLRTTGRDPA